MLIFKSRAESIVFDQFHLHQLVDQLSIFRHGTELPVDAILSVVQLYEGAFFVVLSAKHGLFAPRLHGGVNGFTVFLGCADSARQVLNLIFGGANEAPAVWILPREDRLCSRELKVNGGQLSSDERKLHLQHRLLYLVVLLSHELQAAQILKRGETKHIYYKGHSGASKVN